MALEYVALTLMAAEVGMFMGLLVEASPARAMSVAVEEVEMDAMTATSRVTPPVPWMQRRKLKLKASLITVIHVSVSIAEFQAL